MRVLWPPHYQHSRQPETSPLIKAAHTQVFVFMVKQGITGTPSYRETLRIHRTRHFFRNGLVLVALGLFAAAAALAVVKPPEAPPVYQARQDLALSSPFPQTGRPSGRERACQY